MNTNNFLVKAKREWVLRWSSADPWAHLTPDAASEAAQHLAALPTTLVDDDENAKRFDLIIVTIQLAVLEGDRLAVERLRAKVQAIATNLLGKTTIPAISAQVIMPGDVESDEWWVDVTLPMLELVRRRLRSLVHLVDKGQRYAVYADFTDELGAIVEVSLPGVTVGTNLARFRAKARAWLLEHEDHVALQKLRRNRQLTGTDLELLSAMLIQAGVGTQDDDDRAGNPSTRAGVVRPLTRGSRSRSCGRGIFDLPAKQHLHGQSARLLEPDH